MYTDVLQLSLKKADFGYHIGSVYTGCISYVDIVLMAPTLYF